MIILLTKDTLALKKTLYIINQQIREADEINKQLPPLTIPSTDILSYTTHPQAIYTSRLLDFKNLPEPKNVDNDDNLFETEYSGN